jgi:hypothetical protein
MSDEISKIEPDAAVDFLFKNGHKYAVAKAQRVYLEEFRKSQKAMLMKDAMLKGCKSIAAAEMEAYAAPTYSEVLKGIQAATEEEESLRWQLTAAQARIEVYRTKSANDRFTDKVTM